MLPHITMKLNLNNSVGTLQSAYELYFENGVVPEYFEVENKSWKNVHEKIKNYKKFQTKDSAEVKH